MGTTSSTFDCVTRGVLAKRIGCNIETIRYYEQIGLMPEPSRSHNGYRLYGEDQHKRLRFILRGRELGFSIEELRSLLSMVDGGGYTCGEIRDLTLRHLSEIRAKIDDLRRLEQMLAETSDQCAGGSAPDCPVIDVLYREAPNQA
jgi:MerR family mercuric resistance operon transcriptional regulator